MLAHTHEFDMPTFMHQIRKHKKTMAFHSIEEWGEGEWEGNNTFLKIAEAREHTNSFRLLDSYEVKPRIAGSKADGDLLVIISLEQTLAPFKMLSHRLVEVLFGAVTFVSSRQMVTEILRFFFFFFLGWLLLSRLSVQSIFTNLVGGLSWIHVSCQRLSGQLPNINF